MIVYVEKNGETKKVKLKVERFTKEKIYPPYFIINADADGKNVGSISFSADNLTNNCSIANFSVNQEFRGQGYGRALLMAVEAVSCENNVSWINGYYTGNDAAKNLYESMGYRFLEKQETTRDGKEVMLPWIVNNVPRRREENVRFEGEDYKVFDIKKREM